MSHLIPWIPRMPWMTLAGQADITLQTSYALRPLITAIAFRRPSMRSASFPKVSLVLAVWASRPY